jgi:hypothetical protein
MGAAQKTPAISEFVFPRSMHTLPIQNPSIAPLMPELWKEDDPLRVRPKCGFIRENSNRAGFPKIGRQTRGRHRNWNRYSREFEASAREQILQGCIETETVVLT